jgi:hypothetical protein
MTRLQHAERMAAKKREDSVVARAKTQISRERARKWEADVKRGDATPVMCMTSGDGVSFGEAREKLGRQQQVLRRARDERMLLSMDVTTTTLVGAMSMRTDDDPRNAHAYRSAEDPMSMPMDTDTFMSAIWDEDELYLA